MVLFRLAFLLMISACSLPEAVEAQERTAVRHDFVAPAQGTARLLVYRPHVTVGAQSTRGDVRAEIRLDRPGP